MTISDGPPTKGSQEDLGERDALTIAREGYLIVEDALDRDFVAEVRRAFEEAFAAKVARLAIRAVPPGERFERNDAVAIDFRPEGGNHDVNRWNMHLPSRLPFLDARVIAHPTITRILDRTLGAEATLTTIASDTPMPRAAFQSAHQDDVFPRLTVNVPLVDVDDDNAPIEIWPRTHRPRGASGDGPFSFDTVHHTREDLASLTAEMPSIRAHMRAGTVLIRDQRLIHRGTANRSQAPRPMLSLLYFSGPAAMPSATLTDWLARIALGVRERARTGSANASMLDLGNTAGRIVEHFARSDRDRRRPIPRAVWAELPARARRLLRYGIVEGEPRHDSTPRTMTRSAALTWTFARELVLPRAWLRK